MRCEECIYSWHDDRSPEMCSNKGLIKFMGRPNYCDTYNPNGTCEDGKLNFKGLVRKVVRNTILLRRAQNEK
jgi:hypothetical protein